MWTTVCLAAVCASVVAGGAPTGDATKMVGNWQLTSGVVSGAPLPEAAVKSIRLDLTDAGYRIVGAESPDEGTWRLIPNTKPAALDIHGTNGPNKGKTFHAIARINGARMTVCYNLSGKARPTRFESKKKSMLFLATYVRVKHE